MDLGWNSTSALPQLCDHDLGKSFRLTDPPLYPTLFPSLLTTISFVLYSCMYGSGLFLPGQDCYLFTGGLSPLPCPPRPPPSPVSCSPLLKETEEIAAPSHPKYFLAAVACLQPLHTPCRLEGRGPDVWTPAGAKQLGLTHQMK